jgi:uncharacterized protein YndB with AHSA1/START domain
MTYGTVRHHVRINRPIEDVWELAGDPGRLYEWFPGLVSSAVDGNTRTIVGVSGMAMPEEILVNDAVQHRFQYRLTVPIFKHHRGTIDAIDMEDGSTLVVYSTEADPRTMALVIAGGTAAALDELKRQMETPPARLVPGNEA